jgi:hypothetical protein
MPAPSSSTGMRSWTQLWPYRLILGQLAIKLVSTNTRQLTY